MKKLSIALAKAAEMEAEITGKPVSAELRKNLQLLGAGIFRLVVMGEIKKGKSSFINAMLGYRDLVPTSSNVATSTIFKIRYGQEVAYKVYFTEKSGKPEVAIPAGQLAAYGTEDGNPGNEKQVDFIEVSCPSPILKEGVVIIDTPGLGGTFREHKKITYQYVPKADAVFFVTDSVESPIGALEIEYLKDIRAITRHTYFVQTKISAVDQDAAEARKTNNLDILQRNLGLNPGETAYFMLDSGIRHEAEDEQDIGKLQISGYPDLLSFVNKKLMPAKRCIMAEKAVAALTPVLNHLVDQVAEKEQFLNADTEDKRKQAQQDIQNAQKALEDWNNKEKGKLLHSISKAMDDNRRRVMEMLAQCRPNGEVQTRMEDKLAAAQSKEALAGGVAEINQALPEYASRCLQAAAAKLQQDTEQVLRDHLKATCTEITPLSTAMRMNAGDINDSRMCRLIADIHESGNTFNTIRTGMFGGMAAVTMASIAGGIIGSVIPVVGTVIGSTIGLAIAGFWGGREACKLQDAQELKGLRAQACGALTTAISDMYSKMVNSIDQLNADIKASVQDELTVAMQQKADDLRHAVMDIQQRAKMDSETLAKRKKGLESLKQQLAAIKRVIAEYMPS